MNKFCDVIKHYDLLIDENNDPVFDPPRLKEYMDLFDGETFIKLLRVSNHDEVCICRKIQSHLFVADIHAFFR